MKRVIKTLIVDTDKCTGCRLCEQVCSAKHEGVSNPARSRIKVVKWEEEGLYIPMVCQQCEDAPCMIICPVKAIYRDETLNRVMVNQEKCIGCRICEQYCTFTHFQVVNPTKSKIRIYRDPDKQMDFALYCHQCDDAPCVNACEFDALSTDNDTGAIIVIPENCTACENCVSSCSYEAIRIFPDQNFVHVCDLCKGDPTCVILCPEQAIRYVDRSEVIL